MAKSKSYEDFANFHNEQAFTYSKICPSTNFDRLWQRFWRCLIKYRVGSSTRSFYLACNAILNSGNGLNWRPTIQARSRPGDSKPLPLRSFLPDRSLAEIMKQGFDKLLIYPFFSWFHLWFSASLSSKVNNALSTLADVMNTGLKGQFIPSFCRMNPHIYSVDGANG